LAQKYVVHISDLVTYDMVANRLLIWSVETVFDLFVSYREWTKDKKDWTMCSYVCV